ncbi:MAG: acyltransferase [Hydrogenophaga sp.]|uniref:acyltransferase family protein n=1 Tax=Hydrogenophaga sp. TaxID=1904254 RepID=UPI00257AE5E0|nr:acyltransferase [Hydrogenophaga sp.]MBL0943938.1 acyltransferase [Hydrogenophaga sp.]
MSEKTIHGLQIGRGVAAMAVVLFHAEGAFNNLFANSKIALFTAGHAGVHFFFVISGFIIAHSHRGDIGTAGFLRMYWMRRIFRIVPLFWLVMLAYGVKSILTNQWDAVFFFKTVFLIPMSKLPLLVQAWTLTHEFMFYGLFSLLIVWGMRAAWLFLVWFVAIVAVWGLSPIESCSAIGDCTLKAFLNPINLLFGFGLLAEYLNRCHAKPTLQRAAFCIGLLYFATLMVLETDGVLTEGSELDVLGYGFASFLVIYGIPAFALSARAQRWATELGNVSYPAYLVHGMLISVALAIVARLTRDPVAVYVLMMGVVVVSTFLVSLLIHRYFERPLARLVTPWTGRAMRGHAATTGKQPSTAVS